MTDELEHQLVSLNLHYLAAHLGDVVARATTARLGPRDLLQEIVTAEIRDRAQRSTMRRLNDAKIGRFKPMADFDWSWPKDIDRETVEHLFDLQFLAETANIILAGPQGVGKTMIARNLAYQAIVAGHTALVTTASKMTIDLGQQETAKSLERRLKKYVRPDLLVIDELGYLSYDSRAADLLYEVISSRHEAGSIVLTTNLSFKDWANIFPGATCVAALVDRLTQCADVIAIDSDSYRRRESQERAQKRKRPIKKGVNREDA